MADTRRSEMEPFARVITDAVGARSIPVPRLCGHSKVTACLQDVGRRDSEPRSHNCSWFITGILHPAPAKFSGLEALWIAGKRVLTTLPNGEDPTSASYRDVRTCCPSAGFVL